MISTVLSLGNQRTTSLRPQPQVDFTRGYTIVYGRFVGYLSLCHSVRKPLLVFTLYGRTRTRTSLCMTSERKTDHGPSRSRGSSTRNPFIPRKPSPVPQVVSHSPQVGALFPGARCEVRGARSWCQAWRFVPVPVLYHGGLPPGPGGLVAITV